jgi:hypothetical protein
MLDEAHFPATISAKDMEFEQFKKLMLATVRLGEPRPCETAYICAMQDAFEGNPTPTHSRRIPSLQLTPHL